MAGGVDLSLLMDLSEIARTAVLISEQQIIAKKIEIQLTKSRIGRV
ncbi:hypothetical protein [Vibrio taketomensis]|nr:hypothetical protein [Vibrio taketomensis]